MNRSIISVLLSVYNGHCYLSQAIESILKQTYQDFELIIIDDGSTDSSWTIIEEFSKQDNRIIPIRCSTNIGTSGALNRGLAVSQGQYITRQDSDDISDMNRLYKQVTTLDQNPEIGALGTNVMYIDTKDEVLGRSQFPILDSEIQNTLFDYMCFCGPTLIIRRECFMKAGFHFEHRLSYAEDYDVCLRLAEVTKLSNLEIPLYRYRQHAESVSITKRARQLKNKAIALETALSRRFEHAPYQQRGQIEEISKFIARDYYRASILAFKDNDIGEARTCLFSALDRKPDLFKTEMCEDIITRYMLRLPFDHALSISESIFELLLPRNIYTVRLRLRLISKIYLREIFQRHDLKQMNDIDNLLWHGIRTNPLILNNRGVVSILIGRLLNRKTS